MKRIAGRRLTKEGVLVLSSQRLRDQPRNRQDALDRLLALIREAAAPPPPKRRPTKPTLGSKVRRLESKTRRGGVKSLRGRPSSDDRTQKGGPRAALARSHPLSSRGGRTGRSRGSDAAARNRNWVGHSHSWAWSNRSWAGRSRSRSWAGRSRSWAGRSHSSAWSNRS
ncbi:MAG: hypothetical protein KY446_03680 [Proteobacteria bacterium]|nr:hypothetical protein [Pseudomonadota bacterium]